MTRKLFLSVPFFVDGNLRRRFRPTSFGIALADRSGQGDETPGLPDVDEETFHMRGLAGSFFTPISFLIHTQTVERRATGVSCS